MNSIFWEIFNSNILINLLISLLIPCHFGWEISSISDSDGCAQVFLQENFQGKSISLNDREQVPDVYYIESRYFSENDNPYAGSSGNFTMSVKVKAGCKFITSDKRFLKGRQNEFLEDMASVPTNPFLPRSVSCSCPKICKCEDAVLRQRECARAYLVTDCSNCDSYFTSLLQGPGRSFPIKWQDKVAAILVRKGCDVHLSVPSGSGGTENVTVTGIENFKGNRLQEWNQNISHYECSCSTSKEVSKGKSGYRNTTYPEMISIPKTKSDLLQILNKEKFKNHPGIIAALQSLKNGRSSNKAYILLLGLTGSGKSTAINQLFDHPNITKVGGGQSTTTDIHEYRIKVRLDELGMNNAELRVIDTPGIADTRGIAQDARFLTTLENFLDNHEDLKNCHPNVVLIFSKFDDNRFHGDGSSFVKMLHTIDLFKDRIIDKRYSNVIFVLSHFMSERADITRQPSQRLQNVKKVIEEFSTIPKPIKIIVAENKPEEAQLPSLNGFYLLPNGDFYPKNLFDEIQRVVMTGGDPLGEAVIRTGFKDSDYFRILGKTYPLVEERHPQVVKYLGILGSFYTPLNTTEISLSLSKSFKNMNPGLVKEYPGILSHLQRLFFNRNIHEAQNIPKTTTEILKLFQDVRINAASSFLLRDALNLTVPAFASNTLVGSGYDLINDEPLPSSIFTTNSTYTSNIGFQIPTGFETVPYNHMENIYFVATDKNNYINTRFGFLDVNASSISSGSLKGSIKFGFNILTPENSTTEELLESGKLNAVMEFQMFQMKLIMNELNVSSDFLTSLENLSPFNETDWDNVESWNNFFQKYGTHFITSAFGGGRIKIAIQPNMTLSNKIEEYSILTDALGKIVKHLADSLIGLNNFLQLNETVKYEIKFEGGDKKYGNIEDEKGLQEFDISAWKESIYYNPIMLTTFLNLVPISEVARISGNIPVAELIEEAASALLNASLVYVPISRSPSTVSSRDRTLSDRSFGQGDYQMATEFANIFKTMSEQSVKLQEKALEMMAENEKKAQKRAELMEEQKILDRQIQLEEAKMIAAQNNKDEEDELKREALWVQMRQERDELVAKRRQLDLHLRQQTIMTMQEMRSQQQTQMMQFISAENEKRRQAAQARQSNVPGILGAVSAGISGILGIVSMFG